MTFVDAFANSDPIKREKFYRLLGSFPKILSTFTTFYAYARERKREKTPGLERLWGSFFEMVRRQMSYFCIFGSFWDFSASNRER